MKREIIGLEMHKENTEMTHKHEIRTLMVDKQRTETTLKNLENAHKSLEKENKTLDKELKTLAAVNKSMERKITEKYQHKPQNPPSQPNRNIIVTADSNREVVCKHLTEMLPNSNLQMTRQIFITTHLKENFNQME